MAALLLVSCGHVEIKDETFYVDAGEDGAVTVNFLSSGSEIIPLPQWNSMREGMFCMSSTSEGDFKKEIEKLCSVSGKCNWDVMQNFFLREAQVRAFIAGLKSR